MQIHANLHILEFVSRYREPQLQVCKDTHICRFFFYKFVLIVHTSTILSTNLILFSHRLSSLVSKNNLLCKSLKCKGSFTKLCKHETHFFVKSIRNTILIEPGPGVIMYEIYFYKICRKFRIDLFLFLQ